MTESVDEWFVQGLETYDDLPVRSVSRGELSLDEDEEHDELLAFTPWIQDVLGELVAGVRSSTRLTDSACVLVDDENGMSANMERILRAANQSTFGGARRVLEVNPSHPLIQSLAHLHASGDVTTAEPLVRLLYDDALLLEGTVNEPAAMGRRLQALLTQAAASAASRSESSTS
jgi:molecular chaperone HtpG